MYGNGFLMLTLYINRLFAMFTRLTTNSQNNFLYQEDQENSQVYKGWVQIQSFVVWTMYKSCIITLQKLSFQEFRNLHTCVNNPEFGLMSDCFLLLLGFASVQQSAFLFSCFDALKEPAVLTEQLRTCNFHIIYLDVSLEGVLENNYCRLIWKPTVSPSPSSNHMENQIGG